MGILDELAAHDADDAQRAADLAAALAAGDRARADLEQAKTDAASAAASAAEALAAVTADRDAVQAKLEAYMAAHPEVKPPVPTVGMSLAVGTAGYTQGAKETPQQQRDRYLAKFGRLPVAKVFYSGALPAKFDPTYEGLVDTKRAYVCFKAFTAASLRSYLDSIPAGWAIVLVFHQEPDKPLWVDKTMTIAQYRANTTSVVDVVHAHPAYADGRALVGQCFMEYSVSPGDQYGKGRWVDDVVDPRIDVLCWDWYTNTSPKTVASMRMRLAAIEAIRVRLGIKRWAVLEIGDRRPGYNGQAQTWTDGAARLAYWQSTFEEMSHAGGTVAVPADDLIWFDLIGTTGDHRLIPGDGYSDPLIGYLKSKMT